MKKSAVLFGATVLTLSSLCFGATLQSMSKDDVTNLLSDKTFTTIPVTTQNKKIVMGNEFMGYMDKNGKILGQFKKQPASEQRKDTGTWRVKDNGMLCITWAHWGDKKEFCMDLYDVGNMILFVNESGNVESGAMKDSFKSGNQLKK